MNSKRKMVICLLMMFLTIGIGAFGAAKLMKADKDMAAHVVTFIYAFTAGSLGSASLSYAFKDDRYRED